VARWSRSTRRHLEYSAAVFPGFADDLDISRDGWDRSSSAWGSMRRNLREDHATGLQRAIRAKYRRLHARGGFGSRRCSSGDDMYFGNDRLPLLEP